jgi:hypothetical protein
MNNFEITFKLSQAEKIVIGLQDQWNVINLGKKYGWIWEK